MDKNRTTITMAAACLSFLGGCEPQDVAKQAIIILANPAQCLMTSRPRINLRKCRLMKFLRTTTKVSAQKLVIKLAQIKCGVA